MKDDGDMRWSGHSYFPADFLKAHVPGYVALQQDNNRATLNFSKRGTCVSGIYKFCNVPFAGWGLTFELFRYECLKLDFRNSFAVIIIIFPLRICSMKID